MWRRQSRADEEITYLAGHCHLQLGPRWYQGLEQPLDTMEERPEPSVVAVHAILILGCFIFLRQGYEARDCMEEVSYHPVDPAKVSVVRSRQLDFLGFLIYTLAVGQKAFMVPRPVLLAC